MKKWICTLVLGLACTSCIGTNSAFNGIRDWNGEVAESKWGQEAVHLVCWIVPVYGLALLGDVVIFNSIEFWGGENPVGDGE